MASSRGRTTQWHHGPTTRHAWIVSMNPCETFTDSLALCCVAP